MIILFNVLYKHWIFILTSFISSVDGSWGYTLIAQSRDSLFKNNNKKIFIAKFCGIRNWMQQCIRCLLFEKRPVTKQFVVSHKVDKFKLWHTVRSVPCCERSVRDDAHRNVYLFHFFFLYFPHCVVYIEHGAGASAAVVAWLANATNSWRSHPLSYMSNVYALCVCWPLLFGLVVMWWKLFFAFAIRTMPDRDSRIRTRCGLDKAHNNILAPPYSVDMPLGEIEGTQIRHTH